MNKEMKIIRNQKVGKKYNKVLTVVLSWLLSPKVI